MNLKLHIYCAQKPVWASTCHQDIYNEYLRGLLFTLYGQRLNNITWEANPPMRFVLFIREGCLMRVELFPGGFVLSKQGNARWLCMCRICTPCRVNTPHCVDTPRHVDAPRCVCAPCRVCACHGQTTVSCRSRSRASGHCSSGCLSCTRTSNEESKETSKIYRSPREDSEHLMWFEDDGGLETKRLQIVLRDWESRSHSEERPMSLNSTGERA
jgi:hypothetical protein